MHYWRVSADLTQAQLAAKLQIHVQTIKRYEAGRLPAAAVIDKICKALDKPISEMFER